MISMFHQVLKFQSNSKIAVEIFLMKWTVNVLLVELCNNLDNIKAINFIVINITVFVIMKMVNFWILLYITHNQMY